MTEPASARPATVGLVVLDSHRDPDGTLVIDSVRIDGVYTPVRDRLCYALPDAIPHAPHVWYGPTPQGERRADEPVQTQAWWCGGWAAATLAFVEGLRREWTDPHD